MSKKFDHYAYEAVAAHAVEARINEAWQRGWEVYTFTDTEEIMCSVLFRRRNVDTMGWQPPFADDDREEE